MTSQPANNGAPLDSASPPEAIAAALEQAEADLKEAQEVQRQATEMALSPDVPAGPARSRGKRPPTPASRLTALTRASRSSRLPWRGAGPRGGRGGSSEAAGRAC